MTDRLPTAEEAPRWWRPLPAPDDPELASLAYIAGETQVMPFGFHGLVFALEAKGWVSTRTVQGVMGYTHDALLVTDAGRAALAAYRAAHKEGICMTPIRHRAKRIDRDAWVVGHYFQAPLTDENSGAPQEAGWFFLAAPDQPTRHLIEDDGVAFTVDPATLEPFEPDLLSAYWETHREGQP